MCNMAAIVKKKFLNIIAEMKHHPELFFRNPDKDFSRDSKLNFESLMQFIVSMGGNSISKELLDFFGYDPSTVTSSAFVQQRHKILPFAFEYLLHTFTNLCSDSYDISTYNGYRLFAIDGSDLRIATNPSDPETYSQVKPDSKGYNHLHLNALYDLCNRIYVGASVQLRNKINEHSALVDFLNCTDISGNVIVVGDRGYESYNGIAHIEHKGWKFVIRVKDINSTGIISGLMLPDSDEFDQRVDLILTRKHNNEVRNNRHLYRFISSTATFDFLEENPFYNMSFRVVRIRLDDGSFEVLITNLDAFEFPPATLKHIYMLRWGIETSFRELKYSIGLTSFHSKKRESITQEIFARLTLYNFVEIITWQVVISQVGKKHFYKANFTIAVQICRRFLRPCSNEPPIDVEALIRRHISPYRPVRNKQYPRGKIRSKSVVSFSYRVA